MLRELHRERSELPVLILSARSDLPTKLRSFELGAVDYVAKPFSLDELLARARVQLRRARVADDGTVIRVGSLVLDLARRQARVGDVVADLSDREFRLLHFLLAHVGEVVSRERLLSEVWGYDFDPRSNVVDVCVRRLRRRLGPDAPIETVRNAGYRAAAELRGCRRYRVELLGGLPRQLRGDDRLAELGDDPVSLRLDQPDAVYGFRVWHAPTLVVLAS